MSFVSVIDYGMGNMGSINNMMKYLGYQCNIIYTAKEIEKADNIILPGVGHFEKAINNIKKSEIDKALKYAVYEKESRLLGICLGMQLLMDYSEEGDCDGLGFIKGNVYKFRDTKLKIPHMGWNTIQLNNETGKNYFKDNVRYYFVHSYYVGCKYMEDVMATTKYGVEFHSVIKKNNVMGVQFHPEKSNIFGMDFFSKYMEVV